MVLGAGLLFAFNGLVRALSYASRMIAFTDPWAVPYIQATSWSRLSSPLVVASLPGWVLARGITKTVLSTRGA